MVRTSIEGGVVAGRTFERSPRLPKKVCESGSESGSGSGNENGESESANLKNEKNGKKWEWRLVNEEWVQVFVHDGATP